MLEKATGDTHHTRRTALRVTIATLFPQFAFGVGFAWIGLAPYAVRQSHWSLTVVEAIYALTPLSSAVTFLFSGLLATKLTPRQFCWLGVGALVLVILDAAAGMLSWRTSTAAVLVIAAGGVGFSCGGLVGTVPRMAKEVLPDAFNSILGLLFAAFALGGFIGPLLGSTLGNSSLAWLVLSLISSTGIVIIIVRLIHANHSLRKDAEALQKPVQV